jgi:tRNA threonylcarbamoyladenosine biosynthesis protein TsaB
MKALGIETSSARGSVALAIDGDSRERTIATPREQADKLLELTSELLGEARLELGDLDALVFGRGPGSFTGLRVAAAVAQGYALAAGVPLYPVSSLAALAQRAWRERGIEHALVCTDARMGEVYAGEFRVAAGVAVVIRAEELVAPAALRVPDAHGWAAVGDGWRAYAADLAPLRDAASAVLADLEPLARDLFALAAADVVAGRATPFERALPVYLRESSAWRR